MGIKVPRLDMCKSLLLSKIANQMWCDQPFRQRKRATEGTVGVARGGGGLEVTGKCRGWGWHWSTFEGRRGRQYNRVFIKKGV